MKLALLASPTASGQTAARLLRKRYHWVEADEAETGMECSTAMLRQPSATANRIQRTYNHHHSLADSASLVIA